MDTCTYAYTYITQTRIDQYASFYKRGAKIRSQRVARVLLALNKGAISEDMIVDGVVSTLPATRKQKHKGPSSEANPEKKAGAKRKRKNKDVDGQDSANIEGTEAVKKPQKKRARARKDSGQDASGQISADSNPDASMDVALQQSQQKNGGNLGDGEEADVGVLNESESESYGRVVKGDVHAYSEGDEGAGEMDGVRDDDMDDDDDGLDDDEHEQDEEDNEEFRMVIYMFVCVWVYL
jgi:hypothetical protein